MASRSHDKEADIIQAFNSTSRYLNALLNIDNPYFEDMVGRIYPPELQLNKANSSDTEAPFLDLHLSISNGFELGIFHANQTSKCLRNQGRTKGEGWSTAN